MKSIKENVINKIEINKSIFITHLIKIEKKEEVALKLDNLKKEYKDATHYCYAYIIGDYKKSSDDNEPGGTAGVPIMDTLNKANLDNILCVVIRYFGGIKLGVGGLIRAYKKSVLEALKKAEFNTLVNGYYLEVLIDYNKQKDLEHLLNCKYEKSFNEYVLYKIECNKETYELIKNKYKIILEKEKVIEI